MGASAGLADVQESMRKSSQDVTGQIGADIVLTNRPQKVAQTHVIFKLVETHRKGRVRVDGMDQLKNPETGKIEPARLLRGFPSIWVKDQKDLDKEFIAHNRRSLVFEDSVCRIALSDEPGLLFARLCRSNVDTTHPEKASNYRFYEYNPAKQSEEALKQEMELMEMMQKAATVPFEKLKKHALYLGISFADDLGIPKNEDAIRREYMLAAKNRFKDFKNSFDNKIVDISYLVKKAILEAHIDLGRQKGHAHWAVGGGHIALIPASQTPVEYLTELAMGHSDESKQFLSQLQEIIK
jgi:hypothetical protein